MPPHCRCHLRHALLTPLFSPGYAAAATPCFAFDYFAFDALMPLALILPPRYADDAAASFFACRRHWLIIFADLRHAATTPLPPMLATPADDYY